MKLNKMSDLDSNFEVFLLALSKLESGYHIGYFDDKRYGVSVSRPAKEKIIKLYAEELGGLDIVSFNIFMTKDKGAILKPCEMSSEKVIDFVVDFKLE